MGISLDTPCSFDPFTYTASEPMQNFQASYTTTAIGHNLSVKTLLSATPINVPKPATGPAPVPLTTTAPQATPTAHIVNDLNPSENSRSRSVPKTQFPATHLQELFRLIEGNTKIRTDLVSQLKAHFEGVTTKGAIEAKIKEVAVREGKKVDSQWKIKPEAWVS
jgi:chromatin assembly factor 1 subunit A